MATPAERFKSSVRVIRRRADRSIGVLRVMSRSLVFYGDLRRRFLQNLKTRVTKYAYEFERSFHGRRGDFCLSDI